VGDALRLAAAKLQTTLKWCTVADDDWYMAIQR
jgi:hypothetical protein